MENENDLPESNKFKLTARMKSYFDELKGMTREELSERIVELITINRDNLVKVAVMIRYVEQEFGSVPENVLLALEQEQGWRYILDVARDRLLPEVVERWRSNPSLLNACSRISLSDQQALLDLKDGMIPIAIIDAEGKVDDRLEPLRTIQHHLIRQVFDYNRLRLTPESQAAYLRSRTPVIAKVRRLPPGVKVDRRRRLAHIDRAMDLSIDQLLTLIRELGGA